jgi:hypothetical protein
MWSKIISYLPSWQIVMQSIVALLVPYAVSQFFNWIRTSEKE